MIAVRFLVSGKVQGVWFRASACEKALSLQLHGYARNLADGRVELVAQGQPAALETFESWLQRGPPLARVTSVHCETLASPVDFDGFAAR